MQDVIPRVSQESEEREGFSFLTPLGAHYDHITIEAPTDPLSIREAFKDRPELRKILNIAKEFKEKHPKTFNGKLLGRPKFSFEKDGSLTIKAEQLHYFVYFAAHELLHGTTREEYAALSVCGTIFDPEAQQFLMSVRPQDSQEDPGKIDAPGGTLNPDAIEQADPLATIRNRFEEKLGISETKPVCIGIERIFDEQYSLYNLAFYTEQTCSQSAAPQDSYAKIPLAAVDEYLQDSARMTTPARATLLLALSQPTFTSKGWGPEKVNSLLK